MITLIARLTPLTLPESPVSGSIPNLSQLSTSLGGDPWEMTIPIFSLPIVNGACELFEDILDQRQVQELAKRFRDLPIMVLHTTPQATNGAACCQVMPFGPWDELIEALHGELVEGLIFALEDSEVEPELLKLPDALWEPEVTEEDAHANRGLLLNLDRNTQIVYLRLVEFDIIDTTENTESVAAA